MRYSITTLLALILLSAVLIAAMKHPTAYWLQSLATVNVFALAASLVFASIGSGVWRSYCIGFAVFGWLRFVAEFGNLPLDGFFNSYDLFPSRFLYWMASPITENSEAALVGAMVPHLSTFISGLIGGVVGVAAVITHAGRKSSSG